MTTEQFVYWLQGFMELSDCPLTKREQMIKDHLKEVFTKKTPDYRQHLQAVSMPPYSFGQASTTPNQGTVIC